MPKGNSRPAVVGLVVVAAVFVCMSAISASTQTTRRSEVVEGCGAVSSKFGDDRCAALSFIGQVSGGQDFVRKFGSLEFRLNSQEASSGWFIEIIPQEPHARDEEYAWVVTPPYHFGNIRYLDTSYGTKAAEAVKLTPREFNFVLNKEQYGRAAAVVNQAIHSHSADEHKSKEQLEKEGQEAMDLLFALPTSKGRLDILDSRVSAAGGTDGLGTIEWLKFEVELRVPCDFAVSDAADFSVDRSKCETKRK